MNLIGSPKVSRSWVAEHPAYFITDQNLDGTLWVANVVYETQLADLNFTPSDECVNMDFVDAASVGTRQLFPTVQQLLDQFDPARHQ